MSFRQDIRHAARSLIRQPAFSVIAIVSLTIGIGATTAIFSIANTLFLKPLPGIAGYERAVELGRTNRGRGFDSFAYPDFLDLRAAADPLEELAGWRVETMSLARADGGDRIVGMYVSANYFEAMSVRPDLGREFTPDEDEGPGRHRVAVVSHRFWRDRLNADSSAVGSTLTLNREPFTVVGVAPEGFFGHVIGVGTDVWVPLMQLPEIVRHPDHLDDRGNVWFSVVGRLAEDATVTEADAAVRTVMQRLAQTFPETNRDRGATVVLLGPVPGAGRASVGGFLTVLLVLVGLVLAITCVNVSGMLLAKSAARTKEIAIRLALGASRGRLVRFLLAESLVLFSVAGVAGTLLAVWAIDSINLASLPIPVPVLVDLAPDFRVLIFAIGVTLTAGVAFGTLPAIQATRPELVPTLKDDAPLAGTGGRRWIRRIFVAGQIGISLVLLFSAGQFVRSLERARSIDTGFEPEGVFLTTADLSLEGYTEERGQVFYRDLLARLRGAPGVSRASLSLDLPLDLSSFGSAVFPEGQEFPDRDRGIGVDFNQVSTDYFRTVSTRVLRGRTFAPDDRDGATPVAVVSRTFADEVFPGEDVLGKRIRFGRRDAPFSTIVGVVEDVKNQMITDEPRPFVYVPLTQHYSAQFNVLVRMEGDLATGAATLRREVLAVDPSLSLTPVLSLARYTGIGTMPQRLAASIVSMLGAIALLLAGIGVYGVVAFHVARRTREIGIRIAVGARSGQVAVSIISRALAMAVPGVIVGLVLSVGMGRAIQGFVLGINPLDPLPMILVSLLLLAVTVVSSAVPARRAAAIDPVEALRSE